MHPLSGLGLAWTRRLPCGIEVFAFDISTDRTKHESEILSGGESKRAAAMRSVGARDRFVRSRIALRQTLGWLCRTAPSELDILLDSNGKPHLRRSGGKPPLEFSLSHTGSTLAVAVAHDAPVGIDIEALSRDVDIGAVANRFFPPAEAQMLGALEGDERCQAFFRAWVRKEAIAKATGLGLDSALGGVDLTGAMEDDQSRRIELSDRHVLVADLPITGEIVGAVAVETLSA